MDNPRELYYEEVKKLKDFRSKLAAHAIYKDELDEFSSDYEELIAQAKVITRVSDRLQKKLDSANIQIREQNDQIKTKNIELENTVLQLAQARVGRKASTIMLIVAIILFISEQLLLEPIIETYIAQKFAGQYGEYTNYIGLGILAILFFVAKFIEGRLESYFMNQEKKRIMKAENGQELKTALAG